MWIARGQGVDGSITDYLLERKEKTERDEDAELEAALKAFG
jgi:hypothetical protein